jgi:hypothetical protein
MATPIEGAHDNQLRLSSAEHDWIMGELVRQKARHGDFLSMSMSMIRHFDPRRFALQKVFSTPTSQLMTLFVGTVGTMRKTIAISRSIILSALSDTGRVITIRQARKTHAGTADSSSKPSVSA